MDTSVDQFLDMSIPCLSIQMQSFSILLLDTFMTSQYIPLVLFVRFFKSDTIANCNGTISNMKWYELSKYCIKFGAFIKKFLLSRSTIIA